MSNSLVVGLLVLIYFDLPRENASTGLRRILTLLAFALIVFIYQQVTK